MRLAIFVKESPLQLAKDVDAEHEECAFKVVVLMPDFSRVSTTEQTMVLDETGLCNITNEKGKIMFLSFLFDALPKYKLISLNTHEYLSE